MFAFFYIEFQYNKFNPSTQKNFMQNANKYLSKLPLRVTHVKFDITELTKKKIGEAKKKNKK